MHPSRQVNILLHFSVFISEMGLLPASIFVGTNLILFSEQKGFSALTSCLTIIGVMKRCQGECWAPFVLNVHSAQFRSDEQRSSNSRPSTWLQFSHVQRYGLPAEAFWLLCGRMLKMFSLNIKSPHFSDQISDFNWFFLWK